MTPLAHMIAKDLTLPIKKRTYSPLSEPKGYVPRQIISAHCFDVTDVYQMAYELASNVNKIITGPETLFLPAPLVWIEWGYKGRPGNGMYGMLIEDNPDDPGTIYCTGVALLPNQGVLPNQDFLGTFASKMKIDLRVGVANQPGVDREGWNTEGFSPENLVPAFLLLINSPRVIGRESHAPHKGLARKLANTLGPDGKFGLREWTEIKLQVSTEPREAGRVMASGEGLTGERALHFCRSHLRVRRGRLEVVRGHWRGDPELGIVRSTYRLSAKGART